MGEYVLLTFAGQITILPLIAYHVNRLSMVVFQPQGQLPAIGLYEDLSKSLLE